MKDAFDQVAITLDPVPVYGPTVLPAGSHAPADWWPALEMEDPADYSGPNEPNPRIPTSEGRPISAQLIIEVPTEDGAGWLVFLQNYRGDLGDVTGQPVGTIAGHEAELFSVADGALVQWSDSGRWYGLFGRGLPPALVVDVANGIARVLPASL